MGSSNIQSRLTTVILFQRIQSQVHKRRKHRLTLIRITGPLLPSCNSMQQRVPFMVDLVDVVL
jgi:hypothetical protein